MKYECIKECCHLNFEDLTLKRVFIPGRVYEFEKEPDKRFFKKVKAEKVNKSRITSKEYEKDNVQ